MSEHMRNILMLPLKRYLIRTQQRSLVETMLEERGREKGVRRGGGGEGTANGWAMRFTPDLSTNVRNPKNKQN